MATNFDPKGGYIRHLMGDLRLCLNVYFGHIKKVQIEIYNKGFFTSRRY